MQVICSQCHRSFDVPQKPIIGNTLCPDCNAAFVPALTTVPKSSEDRIQVGVPASAAAVYTARRAEMSKQDERSILSRDWRIAKYTFLLALILRCLIAALTCRNVDEFFTQSIIAPVFAVAVTAMAIIVKTVFFGWDRESPMPGTGALLWLFAIGLAVGAGIGAGVAATVEHATRASICTAAVLVGFVGAFGLLLMGMWCILILGFARALPRKIAKASKPDTKMDEPSQSQS